MAGSRKGPKHESSEPLDGHPAAWQSTPRSTYSCRVCRHRPGALSGADRRPSFSTLGPMALDNSTGLALHVADDLSVPNHGSDDVLELLAGTDTGKRPYHEYGETPL